MSRWQKLAFRSRQFDPRTIPGLALWLDAADGSTLFQDSAATTPATAINDPVGAWLDKSGNGRHMLQPSSSPRPVRSTQNNRSSLSFNGTSQWMRQERTNYRARSHFLVWRRTATPTSFSSPFGANGSVAASLGGAAYAAEAQSLTYYAVNGNHWWSTNNANFAATVSRYQGASLDVAALNAFTTGVRMAPDTTAANVSYVVNANATAGNKAFFAGIEPFADTRLYPCQLLEAIQYDGVLTEAQSRQVERYLASKWGITLAPQVSNADAQDWINRVYANGGTVSATTARAVNQFCVDIENAGIRDRFYRLNLFCGNSDASLNAVRTPLYRGPSLSGTQYGNTIDTNTGNLFVANDYAETAGLLSNGTTKYLNSTISPDTIGVPQTLHMSVYKGAGSWATTQEIIGTRDADDFYQMQLRSDVANSASGYIGPVTINGVINAPVTTGAALLTLSRASSTSLAMYSNGVSVGVGTVASATLSACANNWLVFARNASGSVAFGTSIPLFGYSIGVGLDAPQQLAFYNASRAFHLALGRSA